MSRRSWCVASFSAGLSVVFSAGCDGSTPKPDPSPTGDSRSTDSGSADSGSTDSGSADSGSADSGTSDSGPNDSGTNPPPTLEVTLTPGDPATVVVLSWTTPEPATSTVEFGPTVSYGRRTPRGEALTTEHRVMVVGLPASCDCFVRALSVTASGEELRSADLSVRTADAPPSLSFTTELDLAGSSDAPWVLAVSAVTSAVAIVDGDGALIWWRELPAGVSLEQARVSDDGLSVLYNQSAGLYTDSTSSTVNRVRLDGGEGAVTPTPFGHHDFLPLSDGNIAYIQADLRPMDLTGDGAAELIVGDAIQVVASDGSPLVQVWNSWDSLTLTTAQETPYYPGALDWVHANGLWMSDDMWYLSSHNFSSIFKIDGVTGEILWQLGGDDSDFEFIDGTTPFAHQHAPRVYGDRVFLFNNTDGTDTPPDSYVVEYQIDEAARTVREVRRHQRDTPTYSYILGNIDILEDGSWLVGWGTESLAEQVATDGTVLRRLRLGGGARISNLHSTVELGGPIDP